MEKSDEKLGSDAGVNQTAKYSMRRYVTEELGLESQRSVACNPCITLIKSSIEIQFIAFQVEIKTFSKLLMTFFDLQLR